MRSEDDGGDRREVGGEASPLLASFAVGAERDPAHRTAIARTDPRDAIVVDDEEGAHGLLGGRGLPDEILEDDERKSEQSRTEEHGGALIENRRGPHARDEERGAVI